MLLERALSCRGNPTVYDLLDLEQLSAQRCLENVPVPPSVATNAVHLRKLDKGFQLCINAFGSSRGPAKTPNYSSHYGANYSSNYGANYGSNYGSKNPSAHGSAAPSVLPSARRVSVTPSPLHGSSSAQLLTASRLEAVRKSVAVGQLARHDDKSRHDGKSHGPSTVPPLLTRTMPRPASHPGFGGLVAAPYKANSLEGRRCGIVLHCLPVPGLQNVICGITSVCRARGATEILLYDSLKHFLTGAGRRVLDSDLQNIRNRPFVPHRSFASDSVIYPHTLTQSYAKAHTDTHTDTHTHSSNTCVPHDKRSEWIRPERLSAFCSRQELERLVQTERLDGGVFILSPLACVSSLTSPAASKSESNSNSKSGSESESDSDSDSGSESELGGSTSTLRYNIVPIETSTGERLPLGFDTVTKGSAEIVGNVLSDVATSQDCYHFFVCSGPFDIMAYSLELLLQTRPNLCLHIDNETMTSFLRQPIHPSLTRTQQHLLLITAYCVSELRGLLKQRATRQKRYGAIFFGNSILRIRRVLADASHSNSLSVANKTTNLNAEREATSTHTYPHTHTHTSQSSANTPHDPTLTDVSPLSTLVSPDRHLVPTWSGPALGSPTPDSSEQSMSPPLSQVSVCASPGQSASHSLPRSVPRSSADPAISGPPTGALPSGRPPPSSSGRSLPPGSRMPGSLRDVLMESESVEAPDGASAVNLKALRQGSSEELPLGQFDIFDLHFEDWPADLRKMMKDTSVPRTDWQIASFILRALQFVLSKDEGGERTQSCVSQSCVSSPYKFVLHELTDQSLAALPSRFDSVLGMSLGMTAAHIMALGPRESVTSVIPVDDALPAWFCGGAEHAQVLHAKRMKISHFRYFANRNLKALGLWRVRDLYRSPGAIQFWNPAGDARTRGTAAAEECPMIISCLSPDHLYPLSPPIKKSNFPQTVCMLSPLQLLRLKFRPSVNKILMTPKLAIQSDIELTGLTHDQQARIRAWLPYTCGLTADINGLNGLKEDEDGSSSSGRSGSSNLCYKGNKSESSGKLLRGCTVVPSTSGVPRWHQTLGVVLAGQPASGSSNVVFGLFERSVMNSSRVIGFRSVKGLIEKDYTTLDREGLNNYANSAGFELLGHRYDSRLALRSEQGLKRVYEVCKELDLDGLVLIGGMTTATDAAYLNEYFLKQDHGAAFDSENPNDNNNDNNNDTNNDQKTNSKSNQSKTSNNTTQSKTTDDVEDLRPKREGAETTDDDSAVFRRKRPTCIVFVPASHEKNIMSPYLESTIGFDTRCRVYASRVGELMTFNRQQKCPAWLIVRIEGKTPSYSCLECAFRVQPDLAVFAEAYTSIEMAIENIVQVIRNGMRAGRTDGLILLSSDLFAQLCPPPRFPIAGGVAVAGAAAAASPTEADAATTYGSPKRRTPWGPALDAFIPALLAESDLCGMRIEVFVARWVEQRIRELELETTGGAIEGHNSSIQGHESNSVPTSDSPNSLKSLSIPSQPDAENAGADAPVQIRGVHFNSSERFAMPTNFDCAMGTNHGYLAAICVESGLSGVMTSFRGLCNASDAWAPLAIPLAALFADPTAQDVRLYTLNKPMVTMPRLNMSSYLVATYKKCQYLVR